MNKKYLSDLIGDDYKNWENRKVLITAPTGMGKTTFIVKVLLPHLRSQGQKLLILCNRRLLRQQYWFDLVGQYNNFTELEESVNLLTYQELALKISNQCSIVDLLSDFQTIVCDEAHYFYADSDFNGFGTFALLQMIVSAAIRKQIIFLSATMQDVKPLIIRTIRNYGEVNPNDGIKLRKRNDYGECKEIIEMNYSAQEDYQRFQCLCMPDEPTLCAFLENSPKKSIIFIDNKERACRMREKLVKNGSLDSQDVAILNADNIDSPCNNELVRQLAISHRLLPKILITTAVLDNGVSIHDSEVGNVVIITESKISFLQMLGRIRAESVNECNLIFVIRTADVFLKKMNSYKEMVDKYEQLAHTNLNRQMGYYEKLVWDNSHELADFYRNALVKMPYQYQCFTLPEWVHINLTSGNEDLFVNQFSKLKTGNMYMTECKFYSMAVSDPLGVIYEQMSWIGKEPYELWVEESSYLEDRRKQLIDELLSVQDFTNTELQDFKQKLVSKYHREFFSDVPVKNGTLSLEKLRAICERMGLVVNEKFDSDSRNKLYSIRTKEGACK